MLELWNRLPKRIECYHPTVKQYINSKSTRPLLDEPFIFFGFVDGVMDGLATLILFLGEGFKLVAEAKNSNF